VRSLSLLIEDWRLTETTYTSIGTSNAIVKSQSQERSGQFAVGINELSDVFTNICDQFGTDGWHVNTKDWRHSDWREGCIIAIADDGCDVMTWIQWPSRRVPRNILVVLEYNDTTILQREKAKNRSDSLVEVSLALRTALDQCQTLTLDRQQHNDPCRLHPAHNQKWALSCLAIEVPASNIPIQSPAIASAI
jgi:hypothetical protein